MKKLATLIFLGIIASIPLLFSHCSEEPEPTIEEQVTRLLTTGTWSATATGASITLSGNDVVNDLFQGFTLRFTNNRIFTTGTSPIWLPEDTWQFKPGSNATIIIRGMDGREIPIREVTNTQLRISLEWDKTTFGGRQKSLPGLYEFILTR
jgi:hypothetical protein